MTENFTAPSAMRYGHFQWLPIGPPMHEAGRAVRVCVCEPVNSLNTRTRTHTHTHTHTHMQVTVTATETTPHISRD